MTRYNTRVVHAGLDPDPSYGGVVPAIHQASTYVQEAPGEFVGDFTTDSAQDLRSPDAEELRTKFIRSVSRN